MLAVQTNGGETGRRKGRGTEGGRDTRRGRETIKDFQGYLSRSCVLPAEIGSFRSTLGSREPRTTPSLTEDIPWVKYHFYVKNETFSSSITPPKHTPCCSWCSAQRKAKPSNEFQRWRSRHLRKTSQRTTQALYFMGDFWDFPGVILTICFPRVTWWL